MPTQNGRPGNGHARPQSQESSPDRRAQRQSRIVLPIPDRPASGLTTYDAKDPDTHYAPIEPLRPPKGAPNVLIVLVDDCGFGASSTYGGPCLTPNLDKLAATGIKYTRFHTTALCSPTRQAMLTGRNHHTVGMGAITEMATAAPGYSSIRPNTCAPLAETLLLNGYATAQLGKCHEVPVWETSPVGPYRQWPTGSGFEYFYGFIGGETNQWYPALYEGTTPVEPPKTPEQGYHLTEDLGDKAIQWVRQQKSLTPDQPFFMYFAPGATHAPHHVPKEWIAKYKGKFDQGWDKLRDETFARQKKLGVIPSDAQLTPRHAAIPAWDAITAEMKPILARQMEIYAGFLSHTDHHIGRLLDALDELNILDDTLVYVIIGDNGASAEGSLQGAFNEMVTLTGHLDLETPEFLKRNLDKLGGPEAYNHYAVGWAHAMDTPYQWTKQVASHFGGTRNGTIVHWPRRIAAKGELRHQFCHVVDVAPTILEAAGLPEPIEVNGVAQRPYEGTSMLYSFDAADAPERHETQYFEMFGNRGIYHKGWTAVTRHRIPWDTMSKAPPFDDDQWELYDTNTDWTQAKDLARAQPEKLRELQRMWLIEATKHDVLPLDDRAVQRTNPELAGRPQLVHGDRQILFGGMGRLTESSVLNMKNKSCSVTAELTVADDIDAEGVIVSQGGLTGGWSLYAKAGIAKYCYNYYGVERYYVAATSKLPSGEHQLRMEFAYDGGGLGKGGLVVLYVDGTEVGRGRIEKTEEFIFSADETLDLGNESGALVTTDYNRREFNGRVRWVELDVGADTEDADHEINAKNRFSVAMGLQ